MQPERFRQGLSPHGAARDGLAAARIRALVHAAALTIVFAGEPLGGAAAGQAAPDASLGGLGVPQAGISADVIEIRSHLAPRRFTTLSSQMDGKIERLEVRESDRIRKDQLLVAFDCGIQRALLDRARAIAKQALRTLAVYERLYKLKSKSELEVAQAAADAAAATAETAVMSETVKGCTITAPYSGRVFELHVRRYQYVGVGTPLMGIMDDSELELELIVPSRWLAWIKLATPFSIFIDEVEKTYAAEVVTLGARIDPVSQSVKVTGRIIGKATELLAGMGGRASFPTPLD